MTIDDLRAALPELGFAVYAYEPGGAVTFEVHTPDGQVFSWKAETEADAIFKAFPASVIEAGTPEPPNVFD